MKNLVTFLVVVIAFLGGFSQSAKAQNKTCYKLRPKFYWYDSIKWKVDTLVLLDLVKQTEELLNSSGTNKGFVFQYVGTTKITEQPGYNWVRVRSQSSHFAEFASYLGVKEIDTTVLPIFLGDISRFTIYYPTAEYKKSFCETNGYTEKFFRDDNILLARPDSLAYNDPFMASILARAILQKIGLGNEPDTTGHLMVAFGKAWNCKPVFSSITKIGLNGIQLPCMPTVTCTTSSIDLGNSHDDIRIIDGVILNDNFKTISIYNLMGQQLVVSKEDRINLDLLKDNVYLIQSERKKPIKYFVTH